MSWFDILKIKFKPVDRDRPSPKITIGESKFGEAAAYNTNTGVTRIAGRPDLTPEELALTIAHESTHEAQFNTEPLLTQIVETAGQSLIAILRAVKMSDMKDLSIDILVTLLDEVNLNIGNVIRNWLEQEMAVEIQAYTLEQNFETVEERTRFIGLILSSFEMRIRKIMEGMEMEPEKVPIVIGAIDRVINPSITRMFESFAFKLKRGDLQ